MKFEANGQTNLLLEEMPLTFKQMMAEIENAHERARLLLDSTPLACRLWTRDAEIFDCNEESLRLFKVKDRNEFADRYFELSPEFQPDGRPSKEKALELLYEAFDKGRWEGEWMHQTLDGTPIPVEIVLVRVPYENDYVVAGYSRDLREHKKMISEIEHRDFVLGKLNELSTIMLKTNIDSFKDDLSYCMEMIAKAAYINRVCIWKNSIIRGKLYCSLVYEWPESLKSFPPVMMKNVPYDDVIPGWKEVLSTGSNINKIVRDMSKAEQEQLSPQNVKSLFITPIFTGDTFWGYVGYDDLVNERFFSENDQLLMSSSGIVVANAMLRNEMMLNIKETSVKLEEALDSAKKANNAKSDFLANMSHEMRTPLNAIIGLSELSLEANNVNRDERENLEKIYNAGTMLLSTVNDILDISKIEAGKMELVPIDYDIPSVINDTVVQNHMRIGEKPLKLILNIEETLFEQLNGDELRVKQIINNLLSNAIKYTKEGTVTLTVQNVREGNFVHLYIIVSDTGKGIKAEDIEKLFSDYSQIDLKTNRAIEGTGLGLPLTKKLVEMMDGTISVKSEYGKGSIFKVMIKQGFISNNHIGSEVVKSLKTFHYSDNRRDHHLQLKRIKLPYARILIVDDIPTNLDVAKGMMKAYGMKIDTASGGKQALDLIAVDGIKYDAIFMDQMMPEMDGIEATKQIRAIDSDYAKNIPIIALTANAITGNEEKFLKAGFQSFLTKPIDILRLDEVIHKWIRDEEKEVMYGEQEKSEAKITKKYFTGINIIGLDIKKGIERFSGDEETYLHVLRSYAHNTRKLLESIENLNEKKLDDYAVTVHGLKGSSWGIHADAIGNKAEGLEKAAKAFDISYLITHNQELLTDAWKLIHALDELFAQIDEAEVKPKKDKPEQGVLDKLCLACENYDIDGVDEAMNLLNSFAYETDDGLMAWLLENISLMNFAEVAERLGK